MRSERVVVCINPCHSLATKHIPLAWCLRFSSENFLFVSRYPVNTASVQISFPCTLFGLINAQYHVFFHETIEWNHQWKFTYNYEYGTESLSSRNSLQKTSFSGLLSISVWKDATLRENASTRFCRGPDDGNTRMVTKLKILNLRNLLEK